MSDTGSAEEKVQSERIRNGLRKIIKSFDNYIRDASFSEQLEDNLKHMEETDGNFHRHDLVEYLHDKIETNLGDSIDRSINEAFANFKFDGDIDLQNQLAQNICQEIIKTKKVADFKSSFKNHVLKANEYLGINFHANFIENDSEEVTLIDNENKSVTFTNDFDFSSPDNSLNHNSFFFFTSEQFPTIAQNLDPSKSDQLRLRAMQQLLSIPACDPQAADHWVDIRKFLNYAFRDPNQKISEMCMKLHSRTLASSHYKVSIEIYKNLVHHLSQYFQEKELDKRVFKSNINMLSTDNSFILRLFRLINDYAKDVCLKWTRYPNSFIDSLISETLKFFSIVSDTQFGSLMTPVHYLSLLDIQANWFSKWMHGHESRKVLIENLKNYKFFIHSAIQSIMFYSNIVPKNSESAKKPSYETKKSTNSMATSNSVGKRSIFKKSEIEYAHFVHSLNLIRKILCFKNGRKLFPFNISNTEIGIKDLIKMIIKIIFDTASSRTLSEFSPSKYAYDLLLDLCISEDTCKACLCNEEVIDYLLNPIKTLMQSKKSDQTISVHFDESCMLLIANVLSKLASTENGYLQLLFNNTRQDFFLNSSKNSAAHVISSFVKKALQNKINHSLSSNEKSEYLYIVRLLYSKCQGEFLIKEYALNKLISDIWKSLSDKQTTNEALKQMKGEEKQQNDLLSWSDSLLDNLLNMASTPKGVFYLNETELLEHVTQYLYKRYRSKIQVGKYEKFGYGFLISQLANTPSGCYFLNEAQIIQSIIDDVWIELEFGTDDFMSAFPRAYSVENIDREVYKPMLCLVNILSSFSAVYEFVADVFATPRSSYGSRDFPKGLISLLERVTFLDKKSKLSSLCNFEQSHIFGLKLISILQCDLDILLLIEVQYDLNRVLLNLQKSNRSNSQNDQNGSNDDENVFEQLENLEENSENCAIIIDALSVERNFVLVNSNVIGGPSEKILPIKNFTESKNFEYNFPLFDKLPVPNFYIKKPFYQNTIDADFEDFIKKFDYGEISKCESTQLKWKSDFQNLFLKSLKNSKNNMDLMPIALSQFAKILLKLDANNLISTIEPNTNIESLKSKTINKQYNLSQLNFLGVEKTIEYGQLINRMGKLSKENSLNNLTDLIKFTKNLLQISNRKVKISQSAQDNYLTFCQEESYPGYDWFLSTIFLMNNCNLDSSFSLIYDLHFLQISSFIWSARLFGNNYLLSSVYGKNGISILLPTTCHYIELILKIELPLIFSAFRMSGLSPSQICSNWLKQCFWNYLDWPEIVTYIAICIIYGADFQTYFCVSILKHLNEKSNTKTNNSVCCNQNIVQHHTDRDLQIYLKESQIENFKIENYIDFMFELEKKYRKYILDDIKKSFYPS